MGRALPGDHQALAERLGGVRAVPRLQQRDPQGHLFDERDRERARTLPPRGACPRSLPQRAGRSEMLVPHDQKPRPHRPRQSTLDHEMEGGAERVRSDIRRTNRHQRLTTRATAFTPEIRQTPAAGCTSLSPRAAVPAGGSSVSVRSSAPPKFVTFREFDTDGKLVWSTAGDYAPGGSSASQSRTSYRLYAGQSVTLGSRTDSCAASPPAS